MTDITNHIARMIVDFEGVDIPESAIYRSKMAVLDCIGVALAGFQEPVGKIMREWAAAIPGGGEATIWGTNQKISICDAALVNGTMSHALDYDDMNRPMLGHPSSVLVPAIFAVAEKMRASGRKLLEAYIIGLEVMAKLGKLFGPVAYEESWHPTSVFGVMGACASTCYLLRLSYEKTLNAIGIAASEASGIKKNFGSMTKPLHVGSAARKGIWAAQLAEKGLTADAQALDGTFGFMEMFKGEPYDPKILNDFDESLEIMSSGLVFKQYPCCGSIHSLLDGIIELKQKRDIRPDRVKEIECRVNPHKISYLDRPRVEDCLDAKFSIQYCVATALLDGKLGLDHFLKENVIRSETQDLMKRVYITTKQDLGEFATEVIVRTVDCNEFMKSVTEAKGSPNFPFSEDEFFQKFIDCATLTMNFANAESLAKAILGIEREKSLDTIMKFLRG